MPNEDYYRKNSEKLRQKRIEYYYKNRERAIAASREWKIKNTERRRAYEANYRKEHKNDVSRAKRRCYLNCRDKYIRAAADWAKKNPERRREIRRRWEKSPHGQASNRSYRQSEGGKTLNRVRNRKYYKRHLHERRQKNREIGRRSYRKNHEEMLLRAAERRARNPEKIKQAYQKWMISPKGKLSTQRRTFTRRTRVQLNGGDVTDTQLKRKQQRYRNRCARCGSPGKTQNHHIKPVENGGPSTIRNLLPLCHDCHRRKTHGELRKLGRAYVEAATVAHLSALIPKLEPSHKCSNCERLFRNHTDEEFATCTNKLFGRPHSRRRR